MRFEDRADAGRRLGRELAGMRLERPIIVALPRGGVPVAAEVARRLGAPLELLQVRKIGAPSHPEVAIAAVSDGAEPFLEFDQDTMAQGGATRAYVLTQASHQLEEIERRRKLYLEGRAPLDLRGRTAVLVDDGIATGTTARAAIQALRARQPGRVVLAVPVAPASELPALRASVDELVCLHAPEVFGAVSRFYADFEQTSDEEVVALMQAFRPMSAPGAS